MTGKKHRGLTFGTVFMLFLTAVILAATAFILLRLSDGHTVDLSKLNAQVITIGDNSSDSSETAAK